MIESGAWRHWWGGAGGGRGGFTDQCFVVNLLPDELVLAEGVAGFSCDGVDGSLLHLLLHGTVKHEQRLPGALLGREETERRRQQSDPRTEGMFQLRKACFIKTFLFRYSDDSKERPSAEPRKKSRQHDAQSEPGCRFFF